MDTMLQRLAQTVIEARSLEDLTRPMLEMLETASDFESVYLTTIDSAAGLQHILFSRNVRRLQIPEGLMVPWGETVCKRALEEEPCTVFDVPSQWPEAAAGRELGIRSYVTAPVESAGELYGTLCAASRHERTLSTEATRMLQMFARLIGQQVEREAMITQLRRSNAELEAVALADPLTDLPNRRAVLAELARMLGRARRDASIIHVAFVDLDEFKKINDLHGHEMGDAFLIAVAARLDAALRSGDLVGRYGGDEFVVLGWAEPGEAPEGLAERLVTATRGRYELGPVAIDYPGASVGAVIGRPGEASDAILARADEAMYAAKRQRRAVASGV